MIPVNLSANEQISALIDGQLNGEAVTQAVQALALDAQARANWHAYHLVGDVLRSEELSFDCTKDGDFLSRLRSRLQDEATPSLSEVDMDSVAAFADSEMRIKNQNGHSNQAANDTSLRWKWVAGMASLALVTVLGWSLVGEVARPSSAQLSQTASPGMQSQAAAVPDESTPILIRDPRLDQLLQAHQQFGGASALQMPSGFLRNATFDRPVH